MTRRLLSVLGVVALVAVLVVPVAAAPPDGAGGVPVVELPDAAAEHAIPLGSAIDPGTGLLVEGLAVFHHKEGHDGGPGGGGPPGGGDNGGDDTSSCFALFAKGASWKTVEPWIMNTANDEVGLSSNVVFDGLAGDLEKWETASGSEIFGVGSPNGEMLTADTDAPDGVNEVYFGDVGSPGAIAVTIVWGTFSGPPPFRQIVEWDMVFDQADFDWSDNGEHGLMDFENISTHETGHAAGLAHPGDSCTEETMYRFAATGETKKRDLNDGDIAGINELY